MAHPDHPGSITPRTYASSAHPSRMIYVGWCPACACEHTVTEIEKGRDEHGREAMLCRATHSVMRRYDGPKVVFLQSDPRVVGARTLTRP